MQPEPSVFLRGIRRELLALSSKISNRGQGEAKDALTLQRICGALLHLVIREEKRSEILRDVYPRQVDLLRETFARMRELGLVPPAFDPTRHSEQGPSASDLTNYESIAGAQAACVAALSINSTSSPAMAAALGAFSRAACALEREVRSRTADAIQLAARAEDQAQPTPDQIIHTPTESELTAYLRSRLPHVPQIQAINVRAHTGVNAKEVIFFDVLGHPDWPQNVVMRRDRHFSTGKTSVASEFKVLSALYRAGVIVPRPLLTEDDASRLHYPFVIIARVPGSTRTIESLTDHGFDIGSQLAGWLARIHQSDLREIYGSQADRQICARERVSAMIDRFYRVWVSERVEPSVTLEAGYAWLRAHIDDVEEQVCLVHGDFDFRNILIEKDQVSSILDWELAHIGDPAEDFGYCRADIRNLMPWEEFLVAYRRQGGPEVTERSVRFFEVWGHVFRLTSCSTAWIGYCTGLHRDFIFGSVGFIEYPQSLDLLADLICDPSAASSAA